MNITLLALTRASIFNAPLLSFTSNLSPLSVSCSKIFAQKFSSNFLYASSKQMKLNIASSTFSHFISSPIRVSQLDERFKTFYDPINDSSSTLTISYCNFYHTHSTSRGGAICYICGDGEATITGSLFENCTSIDGGAIFACAKEGDSGVTLSHLLMKSFHSDYCCYTDCSAYFDSDKYNSYGSAVLLASRYTELYYSSTNNCPGGTKAARGAQFDLNSTTILSSYVNATTGNSDFCAAMEYRSTENGTFSYQTIVGQTGKFILSFTRLKESVQITTCNIIDCSIKDHDSNAAILVYGNPETSNVEQKAFIRHFCFINITFSRDKCLIRGTDGGNYSLEDSFVFSDEYNQPDTLKGFNNTISIDSSQIYTNEFQLLGLGKCGGEVVVPTPEFNKSNSFTPSHSFTNSNSFTKSFEFTKSNEVVPNANVGNDKGSNGAMIGGIVAAAVAVVAVVAGVIFYFVRKNKLNVQLENGADLETADSVVQQSNPLYNNEGQDDPFQEDFDATNL